MVRVMIATRLACARHEVAHAAYCSAVGGSIEWIGLTPPQTMLCLPMRLVGLGWRWQKAPVATLRDTIHGVATYLAPYVITDDPLRSSDDLMQLQRWQHAWNALEPTRGQDPPVAWERIVRLAWTDVAHWSTRPGAAAALDALTSSVARAGFCSGRSWLALWHSTQARPLWSEITV